MTCFAFEMRQIFEAVPRVKKSFPNPSSTQEIKYLTYLVFSVCTVSDGSLFFPSVRNLQYGPLTRLVNGMNLLATSTILCQILRVTTSRDKYCVRYCEQCCSICPGPTLAHGIGFYLFPRKENIRELKQRRWRQEGRSLVKK